MFRRTIRWFTVGVSLVETLQALYLCFYVNLYAMGSFSSASAMRRFFFRRSHGNALNRWGIAMFLSCLLRVIIYTFVLVPRVISACERKVRKEKSINARGWPCRISRRRATSNSDGVLNILGSEITEHLSRLQFWLADSKFLTKTKRTQVCNCNWVDICKM